MRFAKILIFTLLRLSYGLAIDDCDKTFDYDVLEYIDPLIGSAKEGNVFAGATLPYGMAKAVADTNARDNQGGFAFENHSLITGFSTLHDSGTGGRPSLGNFALFPHVSCKDDDINGCDFPKRARATGFDPKSVKAHPGYFSIGLDTGIVVDMTTTQHTSLFRFAFSGEKGGKHHLGANDIPGSPLILMDLTDLSDSRQDNATIEVDGEGRIKGSGVFLPSFGSGSYRAFFCADFQPSTSIRDYGIFVDSRATTEVHSLTISRGINGYPLPGGAFYRFTPGKDSHVIVRVATSFISAEHACRHAEHEIPDFNFGRVHHEASAEWRGKLKPIRVSQKGIDRGILTNFYSSIYRTMINPQDYTGENPLWKSHEPYFDSFYCIWDTFRTQFPFLTITDPIAVTKMIRSLIDTQKHLGWLPDCRMSLSKGFTQGGSDADNVIADAYVKGLEGIDWEEAYKAVKKDADVEPFDWSNEGRGGLESWEKVHYIPVQDLDYEGFGTMTRSISRTLEYAYNDFAIAQIAKGLGKEIDVKRFLRSSGNWENLFQANQTSFLKGKDTGFVGFFQPRYLNGTWGHQDPLECSNIDHTGSVCSLQNNAAETFESSIWEYQFFVPHDTARLIELLGGREKFVERLDFLHDNYITYIGNEPSFLTVFQYHYAGRPAKSAERVHFYIPRFFHPTVGGLPGNDDSGTMGAFVAFSMMGLFPNAAQNVYFITPPFFEEVRYTSPLTNKTARVKAVGFDREYKNIYIQKALLDGKVYCNNWLDHSFFTEGKELVLFLGDRESDWGTKQSEAPPSVSRGRRGPHGPRPLEGDHEGEGKEGGKEEEKEGDGDKMEETRRKRLGKRVC